MYHCHLPDESFPSSHSTQFKHHHGTSSLGSSCCEIRCLASFSLLEIEGFQASFKYRTRAEQQEFILDAIAVTVSKDNVNVLQRYLTLDGKQVCIVAFTRIL